MAMSDLNLFCKNELLFFVSTEFKIISAMFFVNIQLKFKKLSGKIGHVCDKFAQRPDFSFLLYKEGPDKKTSDKRLNDKGG